STTSRCESQDIPRLQLLCELIGKVARLAAVFFQVVKLPNVFVEMSPVRRRRRMYGICQPALAPDGPCAQHLVKLSLLPRLRVVLVERRFEAHPLQWPLRVSLQ